ncbi:addiction module protein [Dyadobacter psychrotolerans]|uniref:Uncharacterized protein n=1 Tax=Dyadobacter psychrotolerans TaxID=2541721 RepID=A0A4R5DIM9_9BACT|nr:addiction module protein [Dyadobacter psychrotolerans]TDE13167.1 hypothetical protein E0F88_19105 [Dyadobacter psychrotolerans]
MARTYHIRIKKDYAAALIDDLQKADAIEFISEQQIPGWQIEEVDRRIEKYKNSPELLINEDTVFKILDE